MRGAIVFDFDGVLADSMPLHAEAYRRVLAPFGLRPEDREIFAREGARSETIIADLLDQGGHAVTPSKVQILANEKQRVYAALGPPRTYPGAEALVTGARSEVHRMGLVTGTRRENLERLIPDWIHQFDVIMAQADYTHDKPHPEPYARAADALAVEPEDCWAVENAVRGVQSARAAGYGRVIGITTTMPKSALVEAGAHLVVDSHLQALHAITAADDASLRSAE